MAQIPSKNRRYRTDEEIINDILSLNKSKNISYSAKYSVFNDITWIVAEENGKYIGQKAMSRSAYTKIRKGEIDPKKTQGKLILEHPIPKKQLREMMFKANNIGQVKAILNLIRKVVLITKEEDNMLTKNKRRQIDVPIKKLNTRNGYLSRYQGIIKVIKVKWTNGFPQEI